jgi:hypothetical protein
MDVKDKKINLWKLSDEELKKIRDQIEESRKAGLYLTRDQMTILNLLYTIDALKKEKIHDKRNANKSKKRIKGFLNMIEKEKSKPQTQIVIPRQTIILKRTRES